MGKNFVVKYLSLIVHFEGFKIKEELGCEYMLHIISWLAIKN